MDKTNTKKVAALGLAAGLIVGGIGAVITGNVMDDSDKVQELQALVAEKQASLALEMDKVAELEAKEPEVVVEEKIVNQTVEKIVEVESPNLELVIEDYEGEDLDADEIKDIVDEVIFKNDVSALAEQLVESEIVDFMDDEDMFGEGVLDGYRDDDVYSVSVDEDETVIEDVDYDDKDATVYVETKLKLDEEDEGKLRVKVKAEVEIKDNELELVNVEILE